MLLQSLCVICCRSIESYHWPRVQVRDARLIACLMAMPPHALAVEVTCSFLHDDSHSSRLLYMSLIHDYKHADFSHRRLLGRFRGGTYGLHVDTGHWGGNLHLDREDRLCLVCKSSQPTEDKHHSLF